MHLRDSLQEVRELGLRGTLFRAVWELKARTGLLTFLEPDFLPLADAIEDGLGRVQSSLPWTARLPFADPMAVAAEMGPRIPAPALGSLLATAEEALHGRIVCFGQWVGDYGEPIDWHRNPLNGMRWDETLPWPKAMQNPGAGDIKLAWEVGRFPHAYHLARAAAFYPENSEAFSVGLLRQFEDFLQANPHGKGVHWASGQEVSFRLLSWLFALDVLLLRSSVAASAANVVARALIEGAIHVEHHLSYAKVAVYNNHLLSEALLLYVAGVLLADAPAAERWRKTGQDVLDEQAELQFYRDGAYIQHSHNYHRLALVDLLWACALARSAGGTPSKSWLGAMERSLDFLVAHQNPVDGRLPNFGNNDGARPSPLSTCPFSSFRATLQAVSILVRGERLYDAGPWDESAAWLLGPKSLDAPLRPPKQASVSFAPSGYHVMRGNGASSFGTFRCGSLRDRFSQIDMLHLDVWWRGENVLVDGGSYLYNGPARWNHHFMGTESHNTVMVDGIDQMLHHRRFKCLYRTRASTLLFEDCDDYALCAGEHYGFVRHPGRCVHRRCVLFLKDDLWLVVDTIRGLGQHTARLHWLGGEYSHTYDAAAALMTLETPRGRFHVATMDEGARPVSGVVVRGGEDPPRGWLSRHYAEKVPVPSLAVERRGPLPVTFVSVLAHEMPALALRNGRWFLSRPGREVSFTLEDGLVRELRFARQDPSAQGVA